MVKVVKGKKVKVATSRKRKNKDKNLGGGERQDDEEVDLEEKNGELMVMVWLLYCEENVLLSLSMLACRLAILCLSVRFSGAITYVSHELSFVFV